MDAIRQAYADELAFDGYVRLSEIEDVFLKEKEQVLERFRARMDKQIPTDVHGYLSWFASFNENDLAPAPVGLAVNADKKKAAGRAKNKLEEQEIAAFAACRFFAPQRYAGEQGPVVAAVVGAAGGTRPLLCRGSGRLVENGCSDLRGPDVFLGPPGFRFQPLKIQCAAGSVG